MKGGGGLKWPQKIRHYKVKIVKNCRSSLIPKEKIINYAKVCYFWCLFFQVFYGIVGPLTHWGTFWSIFFVERILFVCCIAFLPIHCTNVFTKEPAWLGLCIESCSTYTVLRGTAWWAENYSKIKVAQYPFKIHSYYAQVVSSWALELNLS